MIKQTQKAYFAAGCFWGVQASFQKNPAIVSTRVGYMGGATLNPSYEQVCSGKTGHAETVEISFEEQNISYADLLQIFWDAHDPTQLNRQGLDHGTQYRSAIFCTQQTHAKLAKEAKQKLLRQNYDIQTIIVLPPAPQFFPAENYHQNYVAKMQTKTGT